MDQHQAEELSRIVKKYEKKYKFTNITGIDESTILNDKYQNYYKIGKKISSFGCYKKDLDTYKIKKEEEGCYKISIEFIVDSDNENDDNNENDDD
jgi:hypothetical protein